MVTGALGLKPVPVRVISMPAWPGAVSLVIWLMSAEAVAVKLELAL
jgi:hypothetical protein